MFSPRALKKKTKEKTKLKRSQGLPHTVMADGSSLP